MRQIVLRAFMVLSFATFVACANGTDSSSVSSNNPAFTGGTIPLSMAERVTVVDAKDASFGSSSVKALDADFGALAEFSYIPSGTPFYTDKARVYVNERSADIFGTINDILCNLNLTGYKEMMNKGYYIALTDDNKCSQEGGSSNGQPNFLQWVMRSIRDGNTAPHQLEGWVLPDASNRGEVDVRIEFRAEITEAKSVSNPFGIFRIDFGMYFKPANQLWQLAMKLFIRTYRDGATGKLLMEYGSIGMEGSDGDTEVAVMNRGSDNLSGSGSVFTTDYIYNSVSGNYELTPVNYNFGFNDTHFRRQDVVNSVVAEDSCYYRKPKNVANVWSYGLYNVNGHRFELNTGFPIKYVYNGADHYGYIGYWGLSLNDWDAPLISNDILYRDDSSPYAGTAYELLLAGGKLTKHFIIQKTLNDFQNMDLDYSYWDYASWMWVNNRIKWNGSVLNVVGVYNSTTYDYDPVPPYPLDLTALNGTSLNVYGGYVGSIEIPLAGCSPYLATFPNGSYTLYNCSNPGPSGTTTIRMRQYATVTPNDSTAIADLSNGLLCFRDCPDALQTQAVTSPYYYPQSTDYSMLYPQNVTPTSGLLNTIAYSFDQNTMLLQDDLAGLDVVFGASQNTYDYVKSGPMITNTTANLSLLTCDADASSTCPDKADTLPVYYTWQTSSYSGDNLALLKELGTSNYFIFDEPLPMSYTHKGSGDYYNQTFILTYYGFDNWISGIPTMCVDPDTWTEILNNDCYGNGGQNVSAFNIPFGGKLTYTEDNGTVHEYFAKALSQEQYMEKLDVMIPCSIINVTSYPLPDPDTSWQEPALGPPPAIDAPPAVVDGELQTQNQ